MLFLGGNQWGFPFFIGKLTHLIKKVWQKKVTGKKAASAASKVLRSKGTGKNSKTAAGSALSQREKGKRK